MKLIDTNALVVFLIGMIDVRQIHKHKRTSIYTEKDFIELAALVQPLEELLILPNRLFQLH